MRSTVNSSDKKLKKNKSVWKLEDNPDDIHRVQVGAEFAHTIYTLSTKESSSKDNKFKLPKCSEPNCRCNKVNGECMCASSRKQVTPTKKIFWEEPKYNPPLSYTHISYEYDAHFKEQEAYWGKGGKKFSGEPRIAYSGPGTGPMKPSEFPGVFGPPIVVFERKSNTPNPYLKAREYNKPRDREINVELASQWANKLNPMTYRLPDTWPSKDKNNSASFLFRGKDPRFSVEEAEAVKHLREESLKRSEPPSIDTRPYSPFPVIMKNNVIASGSINPQSVERPQSAMTILQPPIMTSSPPRAKTPGFSFGKNMPISLWDPPVPLDLNYKRVELEDGTPVIVPFSKIYPSADTVVGSKAKLCKTWGQTSLESSLNGTEDKSLEDDKVKTRLEQSYTDTLDSSSIIINNNNNNNQKRVVGVPVETWKPPIFYSKKKSIKIAPAVDNIIDLSDGQYEDDPYSHFRHEKNNNYKSDDNEFIIQKRLPSRDSNKVNQMNKTRNNNKSQENLKLTKNKIIDEKSSSLVTQNRILKQKINGLKNYSNNVEYLLYLEEQNNKFNKDKLKGTLLNSSIKESDIHNANQKSQQILESMGRN